MTNDHTFCRHLLKNVMIEVRKKVSKEDIKKSWAWQDYDKSDMHYVEFHGPNNYFWYGQGCCLWYAKYKGWGQYLVKLEKIE